MSQFQVNDRVRLLHDIPDLLLHRGAEGVVTSVWCAPEYAYEVEFDREGSDFRVRKVLQTAQIEAAVPAPALHHHETAGESASAGRYTNRG